jgi:protein-disulfide isomerase
VEEGRYYDQIIATREEISAAGISSTPTFDVGKYRAVGMIPYDSLKALVETVAEQRQ